MLTPGNHGQHISSARFSIRRFYSTKRRLLTFLTILATLLGIALWASIPPSSALTNNGSITAFGSPLTENFDSLATSGATNPWTDNTTLPGWYSQFELIPASPTLYIANAGGTNNGAIYSFGTGTSTDRALGSESSGTPGTIYTAVKLTNNTGGTITSLDIGFTGEQWRNGGNVNAQTLAFQYRVANAGIITDANTPATGWTPFSTLDFVSPTTGAAIAALDGNAVANRSVKSATLAVTVNGGQEVWLRWVDINDSGNDHGFGIDDFSVKANGSGPTNPTGVGNANPSNVDRGATTLLTVNVTPGTNPTSTAQTVSADLSTIGGAASQPFFDDGTHGDFTSGDNIFSFSSTVSTGASPGAKSLPVTINETAPLSRTGSTTILLTVNTPTPPTGVGAASPSSAAAGGGPTLLTVGITPGTHPASTGISVTGDLSSIGGSPAQAFNDSGADGDVTAGDNIFSFSATVSAGTIAGLKSLPTTISDAQSRNGSANIALTVTAAVSSPTGTGTATPSSVAAGGGTVLTVTVTPGTGPTSTGLSVTGDLSSIGGSGSQQFFDDGSQGDVTAGDNIFSFNATVDPLTAPGAKNIPFSITDAQARTGGGSISLTVKVPAGAVVISQIYGGGGNSGASQKHDFIEIFNRSSNPVDLTGWSVQYASAGGGATAPWNRRTPLSGVINPGQYYLIREAAGSGGVTDPTTPDITGTIAIGATDGKVALVSNNSDLPNGCPIGNPGVIDFIGYGTADCFEGPGAAPQLSNSTAALRARGGCKDTDNNAGNFTEVLPAPRNSSTTTNVCPASGDLSPAVESTSPTNGATAVDLNTNITVTFDEPVNVSANWFQISCANSGIHPAVTTGGPTTFTINPDVDFGGAEQCSVTINKNEVSDQDAVDPPDNMDADYIFTFTTAIFRDPAEHMVMGNPSGAVTDVDVPLNYLMMKPQYALSYNNDKGTSNWTSWHLDSTWTTGVTDRQDDFRSDDTLPLSFKHVSNGYQFATYGFDRGHMCPSADRTSSVADNSATFLMTNMVPQASGNNQGPWNALEGYIRTQLSGNANELYIISGGTGVGGHSSTGDWDSILDTAGNTVTVPQVTWKVVMVLPNAVGNDVTRVTGSTRTFAVIMPNDDGIRPDDWKKYLATVDQVEAVSGYDFYSNVPAAIQDVFEAKLDVVNDTAPVANNQSATAAEDSSPTITLTASDFNVNNVLTFTVASGPTHGLLGTAAPASCSNGICTTTVTYTPAADYNGPDSFTFTVNDGALDSATPATVTINVTEVNDAPVAQNDSKSTDEDTTLTFPASDLTGNDTAGPSNESSQTLTVTNVVNTSNTHGSVNLTGGQVNYSPDLNYNGTASFDYEVCDNGTTNGVAAPKCVTGIVDITVNPVNDNPIAVNDSATTEEDTPVTIDVVANDTDVDGDARTLASVGNAVNGSVSIASGQAAFTPAANFHGTGSFTYIVSDGHGGEATGNVTITVTSVNDNPVAVDDSATTDEDTPVSFNALANDTDVDGDTITVTAVTQGGHGSVVNNSGTITYSPNSNFNGSDSFTYTIGDGHGGQATGQVTITVNSVNDNPVAVNDSAITNEDFAVSIDVVANDTDVDGDARSLASVGSAGHGSVSIASGKAVYAPAANYNGTDSFAYVVSDGHGGQATGNVSVTINAVNDAPTANSQSVATNGNTPVSITLTGSDLETAPANFAFTVTSGPVHGSVSGAAGHLTYTPAANYCGPDSFKFRITDTGDGSSGPLTSSEATVSINVNDTIAPTITLNNLTLIFQGGLKIIFNGNQLTINGQTFTLPNGTINLLGHTLTRNGATVTVDGQPFAINGQTILLAAPNGNYQTVTISDLVAGASDSCDTGVNINGVTILQASSDEPANAAGNSDGNTVNDIVIAPGCKSVQLRVERDSNRNGRVYAITLKVKDAAGNIKTVTALVTVPKGAGFGNAVNDGPAYTVNGGCP